MLRTVWLAVLCLTLVSLLATAKALRMPASIPAGKPQNQNTIDTSSTEDPLGKSDRLDVDYARQQAPLPIVLQLIEPTPPAVTAPRPSTESKIISRHWRDASKRSTQRTEPKKRARTIERKSHLAAERSKSLESAKPCNRPSAFGILLRAAKLSPACA
jgi:hypothetical protein